MDNNFQLQGLAENDVVDFNSNTYRVQKIIDSLSEQVRSQLGQSLNHQLSRQGIKIHQYASCFTSGMDCQVLRVDRPNWQKGKFKLNISMEFIPEDPEPEEKSELDAVRETINNHN